MRLLVLVALVGCAEHGELPTTCDPDLALIGSPGSQERVPYALTGGETRELCLRLDASANSHDVTFEASDPFLPSSTVLELASVDGTLLETDDARGLLRWVMPPGPTMHVRLSITTALTVASVAGNLSLSFFEVR